MVWRIRIDGLLSTLGTQSCHAALDPFLDRQVQRFRRVSTRIDRRPDLSRHRSWTLEKGVASPKQAGIVRDRNDRRAAFHRKPCAAFVILAAFARFYARALREDRDPEPLREPFAAELGHPIQRPHATAAVDRDRARERKAPAEEGDPQELSLQYQHLRREKGLEGQGFPGP